MLKRQMIINIIRQGRGFSGGIRLCLAPAIQHLHGQGFDFGCISLYTFLVSPFSRFNWPFEVSKRTLFQVLLADLRQSPPGYYSMPLRFFLLFAVAVLDRKSTRLNSSHVAISYAVFCLKKKHARESIGGSRGGRMRKSNQGDANVTSDL